MRNVSSLVALAASTFVSVGVAWAGTLSFTIVDPDTLPVEGVSYEILDAQQNFVDFGVTDENGIGGGTYDDGSYVVRAQPSFSYECAGCGRFVDEDFNVTIQGATDAGNLQLDEATCLGRVTFTDTNNQPVAGIQASAFQEGGEYNYVSGTTDSQGRFYFSVDDDGPTWGIDAYDNNGNFPQFFSDGNEVSCPGTTDIAIQLQANNSNIQLTLVDSSNQAIVLEQGEFVSFNCFNPTDFGFGFADVQGPGNATATISVLADAGGSTFECSSWFDGGGAAPVMVTAQPDQTVAAGIVRFERDCQINVNFVDAATGADVSLATLGGNSPVDAFGWVYEEGENGQAGFSDNTFASSLDQGVDTAGNTLAMAAVCDRTYELGYWFQPAGENEFARSRNRTRNFVITADGDVYLQDFGINLAEVPATGSVDVDIELRKADATLEINTDGNSGWVHVQELLDTTGGSAGGAEGGADPFGQDGYGFVTGALATGTSNVSIPVFGGALTTYLVYFFPDNFYGGGGDTGAGGEDGGEGPGEGSGAFDGQTVLAPAPAKVSVRAGENGQVTLAPLVADHTATFTVTVTQAQEGEESFSFAFCYAFSETGGESYGGASGSISGGTVTVALPLVSGNTYDVGCEMYDADDFFFGFTQYAASGSEGTATVEVSDAGTFYPTQSFSGSANSQLDITMPDGCSQLSFQAGSIDDSGTVTVRVGSPEEALTYNGNTPTGARWNIEATDSDGQAVTDFSQNPFTLTVCLEDGTNASSVVCSDLEDDNNGAWSASGTANTDEDGQVTCTYSGTHLSVYAALRSGSSGEDSSSITITPKKPKLKNGKLVLRASTTGDSESTSYEVLIQKQKKDKSYKNVGNALSTKAGKKVAKRKLSCKTKSNGQRKAKKLRACWRVDTGSTNSDSYTCSGVKNVCK